MANILDSRKRNRKIIDGVRITFLAATIFFLGSAQVAISATLPAATASARSAPKLKTETAVFAAGCFWGVEEHFRKIPGVLETRVGFTGGTVPNPRYDDTHDGHTGHAESVEIKFDPKRVSYENLLDHFFKMHDPTTLNRQGGDVGTQYRSAIYYQNEEQKKLAEAFKQKVEKSNAWKSPITTEITKASTFYPSEEEHQKYLVKHPGAYDNHYLRKLSFDVPASRSSWDPKAFKKPTQEELRKKLTPLQFEVTQKEGTEPPYKNEFFKNKDEGIYVDIVSGEPLFSSLDKFDSGTGWPSFTKPLAKDFVTKKSDHLLGVTRTEVRSKLADSHLGHVFDDGPAPTGLRFCMNSASLRFIPKEKLADEGYGDYLKLFEAKKTKK